MTFPRLKVGMFDSVYQYLFCAKVHMKRRYRVVENTRERFHRVTTILI